jgi:hypothetical protein
MLQNRNPVHPFLSLDSELLALLYIILIRFNTNFGLLKGQGYLVHRESLELI